MRAAALSIALPIALSLVACRSPTQIEVTVTTDLPCDRLADTAVTVGELVQLESAPAATTSVTCIDERIGAVVVIPSGDENSPVAFRVVSALAGSRVEDCVAPTYGPNCIVARRALHFIAHESLEVPVIMRGVCAGRCDDPTTTCVKGGCVPATIDPSLCEGPGGCDEGSLGPGDGASPTDGASDSTLPGDAGDASDAGDATIEPDAPSDAPPGDASLSSIDGAVLGCDLAGAQAGSPRPMWNQCPSHRNRSPIVGPSSKPTIQWTRVLLGGLAATPAIGPDGTLYVGREKSVEALFPQDGGTRWTYTPPDAGPDAAAAFISGPALAADGTVRVFDFVRYTYASLDPATGTPIAPAHVASIPFGTRGSPTIGGDGRLYYTATTGQLVAIHPNGGADWATTPGVSNDFIGATLAPDGTVLVGVADGITALLADGGPRWSLVTDDAGGGLTVSVAVDGTLRSASTGHGDLTYAELDSSIVWQRNVTDPGNTIGIAIADDGTTYASANSGVTAWTTDGGLVGSYPSRCMQPVIDAAGDVYVACDGALVKLDPSLNPIWSTPLPTFGGSAIVAADSPILAQDGWIFVAFSNQQPGPDGGPPDEIVGLSP